MCSHWFTTEWSTSSSTTHLTTNGLPSSYHVIIVTQCSRQSIVLLCRCRCQCQTCPRRHTSDETSILCSMAAKFQNRPTHKGFRQGDLAVRKGKLCVISKINWSTNPPDVTVKMRDTGDEIGTEFSRLSRPTSITASRDANDDVKADDSLNPNLERILKENGLYDGLYKTLTDNEIVFEDLKVMNENDVDELSKQIGLSLSQKLKFRRLIKALNTVTTIDPPKSNKTNQSEEDQYYAQMQAKRKREKSHRAATLQPDDKMTVMLIGDTFAGKTSLFNNFLGNKFKAKQSSTIGIDSRITLETLAGTHMEVHAFDTGGQARWQASCQPYYKRANCVFLCFSVVCEDPDLFENLWRWRQAIEDYAPDDVVVMLVGCKMDLVGATNKKLYQTNRKYAGNMIKVKLWKKFNTTYFECSSKTG
eukprot:1030272_1